MTTSLASFTGSFFFDHIQLLDDAIAMQHRVMLIYGKYQLTLGTDRRWHPELMSAQTNGGKMLVEGLHNQEEACNIEAITLPLLLVQGVATSIDAMAAGLTISEYNAPQAILYAAIIAAVTFVICLAGVVIGRKFGTKLAGKASVLGGVILIAIGLEIFITGIL